VLSPKPTAKNCPFPLLIRLPNLRLKADRRKYRFCRRRHNRRRQEDRRFARIVPALNWPFELLSQYHVSGRWAAPDRDIVFAVTIEIANLRDVASRAELDHNELAVLLFFAG